MPDASLAFSFNHCRGCASCRKGFIYCHQCQTAKPVTNFYRDRRGSDRYHAGCKACRRKRSSEYLARTYVPRRQRSAA